jgi:type VI secretion system protein ImpF
MARSDLLDRLQPALLDRLSDDRRRADQQRRPRRVCDLGQAALALLAAAATQAGQAAGSATATTAAALAAAPAGAGSEEPDDRRTMTKAQLRDAVLRDLAWLFNAVQPLRSDEAQASPAVADSVMNYGLPALSGLLASRIDIPWLERAMRQAILRFEPRIIAPTLVVRALEASSVLDTHNVIEFEIHGELWAQPVPLELLLRTQVDLEAGQVVVRDVAATAAGSLR